MSGDIWSRWLLDTRYGGDAASEAHATPFLLHIRDHVLEHAEIQPGDVLLDVGTGDGLIGLSALDRVGPSGRVIFSDISQPLLDHTRSIVEQRGDAGRCEFVRCGADDLAPLAARSVDAVTVRSVLIYVNSKTAALRECWRVLRPGGRASIYEPVSGHPALRQSEAWFSGLDLSEIPDLVRRLHAFYQAFVPANHPMIAFTEMDLLRFAEAAGFAEVHFELWVDIELPAFTPSWEAWLQTPTNPVVPPPGEALRILFTPAEQARFEAAARPLLESGRRQHRGAAIYLWARKR